MSAPSADVDQLARDEPPTTPLTAFSPAGGCGCKLGPQELALLLAGLRASATEDAAPHTWDDAALLSLGGSTALVCTVDFFTPVVDDAGDWGAIAAANALSDVYAMGGEARLALSVAAWNPKQLPLNRLSLALASAQAKLAEAGATLAGGHTIRDSSPKLGFTIIGEVAEDAVLRASGGQPGDVLILTKPIGSGVVCSALKAGAAPAQTVRTAVGVMSALNASAARAAVAVGLASATDITGFGLAGHLHELALASGVSAELSLSAVPVIDGAPELVPAFRTSNADGNRRYASAVLSPGVDAEDPRLELLFDPQSSGGLLLACPEEKVTALRTRLRAAGAQDAVVGRLIASGPAGRVLVVA